MTADSDTLQVALWSTADLVTGPVQEALDGADDIELAVIAPTGIRTIAAVRDGHIDVVLLDVGSGDQGTATAINRIHQAGGAKVVMVGSVSFANVKASLRGLMAGAVEFVPVPTPHAKESDARAFRKELTALIRGLGKAEPVERKTEPVRRVRKPVEKPKPVPLRPPAAQKAGKFEVLLIGSSTGGPKATSDVVTDLGPGFGPPILITQHMPAGFTDMFAKNLQRKSGRVVTEATDGEVVAYGHAYVAPGGLHMTIKREGGKPVIRLTDDPPVNFCKPAVDPLFDSAAEAYEGRVLAVVLTGMGSDGAHGAVSVRAHGGSVLVQDEETSVVWGMPGATVKLGAADEVLALDKVAPRIRDLMG